MHYYCQYFRKTTDCFCESGALNEKAGIFPALTYSGAIKPEPTEQSVQENRAASRGGHSGRARLNSGRDFG
jgi:hypothetical protein